MRRLTLVAALALLVMLSIASVAAARGGDRNRDRLPDRWERAHHLSLKVNQARRDQDHDGLTNRGEFRADTDPRDEDSDNDGVEDGEENAGTIDSFEDGVLTIALAQGGKLSARVDGDTEIECHTPGDLKSRGHSSSLGDDEGPNHDAEDEHGDDDGPNHDDGDDGDGDDDDGDDVHEHGEDDDDQCDAAALAPGTKVHEAELELTSKGTRWEELELITS